MKYSIITGLLPLSATVAVVTPMCRKAMEVAQRKKSELHQSATQQSKRLLNVTMQSGTKPHT